MNGHSQTLAPCECELPGEFYTGVPGILAAMSNGAVDPQAVVERCDQCCRYESDAAAFAHLVELGLISPAMKDRTAFTVHCYAVVRVTFPGILANDPKEAASRASERFCWDIHKQWAGYADDFTRFQVEFGGDGKTKRSCEFDRQLNELRSNTAIRTQITQAPSR